MLFYFIDTKQIEVLHEMDELIEDIDRVIGLLNVLKSRYFFLHTKNNIGKVLTTLDTIVVLLK